jgi:hypothetical protein
VGSVVYFLQRPHGGPIKVGHSVRPERRAADISASIGDALEVIATAPGGQREEKDWHWDFRHARMYLEAGDGTTEWFLPTGPVADYIDTIGGRVRGEVLREFDAGFDGRDGELLLDEFLNSRGVTQAQAAAEIPCSTQSICYWRCGRSTPDEIAAEMIELWTGGAVPRRSWLTRNGVVVALRFAPIRGLHQYQQARRERLEALRARAAAGGR